jgi:ABC-type transport system involved in multi-copper enzyme maturation permease subunit
MSGARGHRLGPGPVFAYEWLAGSRRWQGYALRSLFVLMLLAALVVVRTSGNEIRGATTIRALARVGGQFYVAVIGTQLTLVLLAAPAATAGAICLDRARGTLAHLLVTDLSDGEIVLGKLAARLVPVLGLVGCTLPVLSLLTLLGGVDPMALLGAFAVTLGTAVLGCCLALAFSLWAGKTHEALLGTYAVWGLWLLGRPMIDQLNRATGWSLAAPPRTADPFALAFAPYWWPGLVGWGDYLLFLGVTGAISAVLALLAVLRLRPVCAKEPGRRAGPSRTRFGLRAAQIEGALDRARRWGGPSLDRNPVLWREWHRARPSRWARIVGALFVVPAVTFSVIAIVSGSAPTAAWVNGMQVSVGLLLLSVTAASSLAEERVRGGLDVLMATPLTTRQIVLGKWLGTFRLVPPLAILPCLVILGGARSTPWRGSGAVLMAVFVLCGGAAITSLGLALATWLSRLGRAVGATVTLYLLVAVGWLFLAMMVSRAGPRHEGLLMGSPFFWAGEMSFELYDRAGDMKNVGWALFWTFAYASAAVALLVATMATFNRCLGRVEAGLTPSRPVRPAKKPNPAGEIVGEPWEGKVGGDGASFEIPGRGIRPGSSGRFGHGRIPRVFALAPRITKGKGQRDGPDRRTRTSGDPDQTAVPSRRASASRSTGLARWASKPAAWTRRRSSGWA